jgi:hypothetical protein
MSFETGESLNDIAQKWLEAKEAERKAVDLRRDLEDAMLALMEIPESLEGTKTAGDHYQIKVTGRMNRTIDANALQEMAAESGLTEHLASLFRWKPEINAAAWKSASDEITAPLLGAITTKPGRPSFAIKLKSVEEK